VAADTWSPKNGAVIGAIFWPVALFVATEILTRVAWPSGLGWQLLRWLGMLPVAVVAALVSYRHLSGLLAFYGEERLTCVLGPLAVDGLMVMATGAILATGHRGQRTTTTPNAQHTPSLTIPAVPDLTEVPAPTPAVPAPSITAPPTAADNPKPTLAPATPDAMPASRTDDVPTPAQVADRVTPNPTTIPPRPAANRAAADGPRPKPRKPSTPSTDTLAASAADTPVTEPKPAQLPLPLPVAPDLLAKARQTAEQYRTEHGEPITAGKLAARLRINSDQAAQALAVLNLGPDNPTTPVPAVNGKPVKATR
jgi:hypothetical protein